MNRLASIFAFLFLTSATIAIEAQGTIGEISAVVTISSVEPLYPVSNRGNAGHVVYEGEPFVVQLTLLNESQSTIRGTSDEGWLAAVRIDLEGTSDGSVARAIPFSVDSVISRPRGVAADKLLVAAQEKQEARLLLMPERLPSAGQYRLRVTFDRTRLSSRPGWPRLTRLDTGTSVEIHSVDTVEDRRNVLYRRGVREWLAGRNAAAREILSELVKEHPSRTLGWYALGKVWATEGRCGEAITAFQLARLLIEKNADSSDTRVRNEDRSAALRAIESDAAKCRR